MKRTNHKNYGEQGEKPTFILTADWHLREDVPICRTDDFWETQWAKVDWIANLSKKYDCPVICAGDIFNHWKPSPFLINTAIKHLPEKMWAVAGNHDLPQHNLELMDKCGIGVLARAKRLQLLEGCHFGQEPTEPSYQGQFTPDFELNMLVWHVYTYEGQAVWEEAENAPKASKLLKTYPEYNLILTGDNHIPFTKVYQGRILVNPGSLMRQTAAQIDHTPRVYLYYGESHRVEPVFIPIEQSHVTRTHLEKEEARQHRIESFVNSLNHDWKVGFGFGDNMKKFLATNKIRPQVVEIINNALDNEYE